MDCLTRRKAIAAFLLACVSATAAFAGNRSAGSTSTNPVFEIDARVALSSLISLSDGHLMKMADSLHILAGSEAARTGDWERIRSPLADVAERNVPALVWFARTDGSYWSIQGGKAAGNLSTRAYFPRVLDGETILGDLVVSKATAKPAAIVAVPVVVDRSVIGVLGASVYLDRLAAILEEEMGLDETMIFYSFDRTPLVALDWDPDSIFMEPGKSGEEDLIQAFEKMLNRESGLVRYSFRGRVRQVIFRRSPVTDWWYAFGIVPAGRAD